MSIYQDFYNQDPSPYFFTIHFSIEQCFTKKIVDFFESVYEMKISMRKNR